MVHHGLDDDGLFQHQHRTQQVVMAAWNVESDPQAHVVAAPQLAFVDHLQQQLGRDLALEHALRRMTGQDDRTVEAGTTHGGEYAQRG